MKTSGGTIYALAEMIYGGAVQLLTRLHMHAFVCMYVGRYLYREMVVCMYIYIDMLQQGPGVMLIQFFFSWSLQSYYILLLPRSLVWLIIRSPASLMWASIFNSCPPSLQRYESMRLLDVIRFAIIISLKI
jgi:hypothetical protein